MKRSILALAFVAAAPAFAGNTTDINQPLTRAEVHAQAVQAVRLGQVAYGERDFAPVAADSGTSTLTRAEVRAQAIEAVRLGQVQSGEYGGVASQDTASVKTRHEVKAELAAYMKTPEYATRNAEASR